MKLIDLQAVVPGRSGRLAAALVLSACMSGAYAQGATAPVATLGSVSIGADEVARFLQSMPPAERAAAKNDRAALEAWLRQRITSEALLREAQQKGWAERPEVKRRIDAAVQEVTSRVVATSYLESITQVPANFPSDADLKSAYEANKANFAIPATYRVAQIFIGAPANDAAAVEKGRTEARALAAQARQGDFAALAKSRSQDQASAAQGGEVGALPLAQMLPEVREVVAKLKPGQVSDAVQSPGGFHIVKLLEQKPARTASFEEARPRLQQALRQQRQQEMVQAHMAGLAQAGSLKIDGAALDAALKSAD